jgi:hypothetical protein
MAILVASVSLASLRAPEAPASHCASASCYRLVENVFLVAIVESELELGQVQRQIFLAHVVVGAHYAALKKTPKALNRIGVDDAANVLARTVRDDFVRHLPFQIAIAGVLIRGDQFNVIAYGFADKPCQSFGIRAFNHFADDASFASNCAYDRNLASAAGALLFFIPVAIAVFPTDIGFVDFDDAHQLLEVWIVHSAAQSHADVPSCFVRTETKHPMNLKCAHSLLGSEHQVQNFEPSQQRLLAFLKDGSRLERETIRRARLRTAFHTLPVPRLRLALVNVVVEATSATDTIGPATCGEIRPTGFLVRKQRIEIAQCHLSNEARFVDSGAFLLHVRDISAEQDVSQVRYTPPREGVRG